MTYRSVLLLVILVVSLVMPSAALADGITNDTTRITSNKTLR